MQGNTVRVVVGSNTVLSPLYGTAVSHRIEYDHVYKSWQSPHLVGATLAVLGVLLTLHTLLNFLSAGGLIVLLRKGDFKIMVEATGGASVYLVCQNLITLY